MSQPLPPVIDYEGSDYQTTFWERSDRLYEDQVEAVALHRLLPQSGQLLLEIGAGAGRNTPRYRGFERIVLLDYSLTQLQQAQQRLGKGERYTYVAADVYRLPFVSGMFEAATMIRVLHHLSEPPQALRQIREVLQDGGAFILEYANKQNMKAILRYLLRRQSWSPFSLEAVEFAKLNYDFHPKTVKRWLMESGFQLERQLTVSHFRLRLLKKLLPLKLLVGMDTAAQLTGDWWQLTPSVFTRNRAEVKSQGSKAVNVTDREDMITWFKCPACGHTPLDQAAGGLACGACQRTWQDREGIYDFRLSG